MAAHEIELRSHHLIYCMLCCQPVREPQLLPCDHCYCRSCWQQNRSIISRVNLEYNQEFPDGFITEDIPCPCCGTLAMTACVEEGPSKRHPAYQLLSSARVSMDVATGTCQFCKESAARKASTFCLTCWRDICEACGAEHQCKMAHQLGNRPVSYYCRKHPQRPCQFVHERFKSDLCTLFCSSCEINEDRSPRNLQQHLTESRDKLTSQITSLEDTINSLHSHLDQLGQQEVIQKQGHEKVKRDVERHTDLLMRRIQLRKKQLCDEIQEHEARVSQALSNQRTYIEYNLQRLHNVQHLVHTLCQSGQDVPLLANYVNLRCRAWHAERESQAAMMVCEGAPESLKLSVEKLEFSVSDGLDLGQVQVNKKSGLPVLPKRVPSNLIPRDHKSKKSSLPSSTTPAAPHQLFQARLKWTYPANMSTLAGGKPKGMTFVDDDSLVVAYHDDRCLRVFGPHGRPVSELRVKMDKFFPHDVCYDSQDKLLYVTDSHDKQVRVFTLPKTTGSCEYQTPKNLPKKFNEPFGIAFDRKNRRIVVTDILHPRDRVHVICLKGFEYNSIARSGSDFSLEQPQYVTVDSSGRIWVSDTRSNSIVAFDGNCKYLGKVGQGHRQQEKLNQNAAVKCDEMGNILVSDSANHRVCMYDNTGRYIRDLVTQESHDVCWPTGLAVSRRGQVALVRGDLGIVMVFTHSSHHDN